MISFVNKSCLNTNIDRLLTIFPLAFFIIQVILTAVLFSLLLKKAELVNEVDEEQDEESIKLEADEEYLYPVLGMSGMKIKKDYYC